MSARLILNTVAIREDGCFSVLLWDGRPFAVSVERTFPGEGGRRNVILPRGLTTCKQAFFHHGNYPTYEIHVEGHDLVLFHKGNTQNDSLACVCVAESFGVLDGKTAVLDSKHGFEELMQLAAELEAFDMEVINR